jgi:TPR repeat protein
MANLPPRTETKLPPPPSYPSDAPVLDQVRKALRDGITPAEAVVMARALPDRPERADAAFLLLEYAAENGNAEAALAVGCFYDPSDEGVSGTIRKNPTTAYDWYTKALAGGQKSAHTKLSRLRSWVEAKATQGSREAQLLLNDWR